MATHALKARIPLVEAAQQHSQTAELFEHKVKPTLAWNTLSGNAYTASLWLTLPAPWLESPRATA